MILIFITKSSACSMSLLLKSVILQNTMVGGILNQHNSSLHLEQNSMLKIHRYLRKFLAWIWK